ncbi:MAG: ATP-dependent DNA helicase, partial [Candidatus Omnitrophota bacterium]
VSTFHSFANSIILDSEEAANYIQDRIQITDIENVKAIEYILDHTKGLAEIRPFRAPYFYVKDIQKKISDLKMEGVLPEAFLKHAEGLKPDGIYIEEKHIPRIKALAIVYDQYERLKQGKNKDIFDVRGRYDYNDMIMMATGVLNREDLVRKKYEEQFTYIMVDEFQDTNGAQLKLLFSLLKGPRSNICCVGDDDQSIYRFQGASVANFRELRYRFKGLKTIALKDNYRSAKEIIDLSQDLIGALPQDERTGQKALVAIRDFKKKSIECHEFTTQEEEMCFVVDRVKEIAKEISSSKELSAEEKKLPYNSIAVLVRKRKLIPRLIDAFLKAGIPYATDGKEDIKSEPRARQMLDVLEFVDTDPEDTKDKDRLLYNLLIADYFQIPHRDILNFINKVNKKKRARENVTFLSELFSDKALSASLKKATNAIAALTNARIKPAHTVLMDYIREAGVFRFILKKYDKDRIVKIRELRTLALFVNMVKESDLSRPGITLRDFVEEIRTRNEHNLPVQGELVTMTQNGVKIFTAHGSKGQEFHSVIIPFCLQDASWPMKPIPDKIPLPPEIVKSTERVDNKERKKGLHLYDETRLFYVAVSRAKSNVLFTSSPRENEISSSFVHQLGLEIKAERFKEEDTLLKSLTKADLKDPFIGTEAVLRDMVSDLTLNPTSLNNYLKCRRRFLYDNVLMVPSSKKQSLMFGTAVHDGLEKVYTCYMRTKRFPDFQFFKSAFVDSLRFQGPEKGMELHCMEEFEGLRKYFDRISSCPVMPIGLENRMPINIDGIVFTGKYDKVEMEDKGKGAVRVVDYKTGPSKNHAKGIFGVRSLEDETCDDYLRQLVSYKLLYEKDKKRQHKDLFVSHGILVFVEPSREELRKYNIKKGEPAEFRVELTEEMVDEMAGIIKNAWRSIQGLHFEKLKERDPDKKKCGGCDFDHICWG